MFLRAAFVKMTFAMSGPGGAGRRPVLLVRRLSPRANRKGRCHAGYREIVRGGAGGGDMYCVYICGLPCWAVPELGVTAVFESRTTGSHGGAGLSSHRYMSRVPVGQPVTLLDRCI